MPWNRGGNQKSNGAGNCLAKQKQKHVKARPAKKGAPGNIDEFEMQIQLAEAAKEVRWMIVDWFIYWFIYWFFDWLIDWRIDWLINTYSIDWLIDWLIDWWR